MSNVSTVTSEINKRLWLSIKIFDTTNLTIFHRYGSQSTLCKNRQNGIVRLYCLCHTAEMISPWSRVFQGFREWNWSYCRILAPWLPKAQHQHFNIWAAVHWLQCCTNSAGASLLPCTIYPACPSSQGVLGKLFLHIFNQITTIQSNSPFRPWVYRQCKDSLLAWISDNKWAFFRLKRNADIYFLE